MPELNDEQDDLAATAARARDGDHTALGELVRLLQDDMYRLALRFRWGPEDMERLHDLASLMRIHPEYRLPARAWIDIERLLDATEQKASRDA